MSEKKLAVLAVESDEARAKRLYKMLPSDSVYFVAQNDRELFAKLNMRRPYEINLIIWGTLSRRSTGILMTDMVKKARGEGGHNSAMVAVGQNPRLQEKLIASGCDVAIENESDLPAAIKEAFEKRAHLGKTKK